MSEPSITAARVALVRAWEAGRPPEVRVCHDLLAEHMLPDEAKFLVKTRLGQTWFGFYLRSDAAIAVSDYIVLRTRTIDAHLEESAQNGLAQLVVLGAGYDTRAYRFPQLKDKVKIIEVDRPETQEVKKARLIGLFGSLPDHVTFVPTDFEKDGLAASLDRGGFDPSLKTLLIWEGVTYYLESRAVDNTLAFVTANTPPGSAIVFDYILPEAVNGATKNPLMKGHRKMLRRINEPMKFGLEPREAEQFLTQRGFDQVLNLTAEQCMEKFLTPSHGKRSPFLEYSIVRAGVARL